jgi:hypothetical protein
MSREGLRGIVKLASPAAVQPDSIEGETSDEPHPRPRRTAFRISRPG